MKDVAGDVVAQIGVCSWAGLDLSRCQITYPSTITKAWKGAVQVNGSLFILSRKPQEMLAKHTADLPEQPQFEVEEDLHWSDDDW